MLVLLLESLFLTTSCLSPNKSHSAQPPPSLATHDNCIELLMAFLHPPLSQKVPTGTNPISYHCLEIVCGLPPSACLCFKLDDAECTEWSRPSNGQQMALVGGSGANTCQRPTWFWKSVSKDEIRSLRIYSNTFCSQSTVLWFHISFHFSRGHSLFYYVRVQEGSELTLGFKRVMEGQAGEGWLLSHWLGFYV